MGLGFEVEACPSNLFTLDVSGWFGGINTDERGLRPFAIPMAGVGYYW